MRLTRLLFSVLFGVLLLPTAAKALTIDTPGARLSINGYLDLQYTYMGQMPMLMGGGSMIMPMDDISTLDQNHFNLIVKADQGPYRINVNLQSRNAFASGTQPNGTVQQQGDFELLEAYGEWREKEKLNVRGGTFLAPFGIYNHMRFATALFAPVVLATMYEPPANYAATGGLDHVVPDSANLMLSGKLHTGQTRWQYAAYIGGGDRNPTGSDENKNKAVGGKLSASSHGHTVGASVYNANDVDSGARTHTGLSLDLNFGDLNIQSEVLSVKTNRATDIMTYYARLSYLVGMTTPFVGYDYFEDKGNAIYKDGMQRWSLGIGYEVSPSTLVKAEYHYHVYDGAAIKAADVDVVHMVRLAAIMVF